jgi:hypothetical protein
VGKAGLTRPNDLLGRYPELRELPPEARPEFMFAKLFGATLAPSVLPGLVRVAQEWKPALVLSDAAELCGPIVAAELGVPSVTKGFGATLPESRLRRAADEVAPLWESRGLEPRPYCGGYDHLYIDIFPPALGGHGESYVGRRQRMRPVTDDSGSDGDSDLPLPAGRPDAPLVYVTMGTVFNDPGLLAGIVTALATLDARVLVTVGPDGDPDALGPQPDHVRVERYVPQGRLLPECDVVVSHAGSGTVLSTLALGTPQLCLPQGADQFLNADAVAGAGAGIALTPEQASPEAVGLAVDRLLSESDYPTTAAVVAASIASMPSPAEVAEVLEEVVAG